MNAAAAFIAFIFGLFYGSRVVKANTIVLILSGVIVAVLVGNYAFYPVDWVATTYASAVIGAALGSRVNK